MEFPFDTSELLPGEISVIFKSDKCSALVVEDANLEREKSNWSPNINSHDQSKQWWINQKKLGEIITEMGKSSAKAQELQKPITTVDKLTNFDQRLYILREKAVSANGSLPSVIGILKVGAKRLFLSDANGRHHEVDPLCILDFYIHEMKQRQGFGRVLFDSMLKREKISPEQLAIDRPSSKFILFLQKHYLLENAIIQPNNFVIFPGFFPTKTISGENGHAVNYSRKSRMCANGNNSFNEYLHAYNGNTKQRRCRSLSTSAERCLQWTDSCLAAEPNHSRVRCSFPSAGNKHISNELKKNGSCITHNSYCDCIGDNESASNKELKHSADLQNEEIPFNVNISEHTASNTSYKLIQQKYKKLDSSWNVLGVKSPVYSYGHNQNNKILEQNVYDK